MRAAAVMLSHMSDRYGSRATRGRSSMQSDRHHTADVTQMSENSKVPVISKEVMNKSYRWALEEDALIYLCWHL